MEKKKTQTKILSEEAKEFLYSIDDYAKGNISDYKTHVITLDCTEEDLKFSLDEGVVFRQFFKAYENNITVPTFFTVVEGVYNDIGEYLELLNTCKESSNTLFVENINGLLNEDLYKDSGINKLKNAISSVINLAEFKYAKFFLRDENKFDVDKIINSRDKKLSKFNLGLQRYLFNKLNTYLNCNAFQGIVEEGEKYKLLDLICNLDNDLVEKLSNFDICKSSPKVILFLGEDKTLQTVETLFLGYLHTLGVDLIIFTPGGLANIDLVLNKNMFSELKLYQLNSTVKYKLLKNINKYMSKYRLKAENLLGALSSLGYNGSIKEYRRRLKIIKHPILYKISTCVSGKLLVSLSFLGGLVSFVLFIYNVIAGSDLVALMGTIVFILGATFIFGLVLLGLEL